MANADTIHATLPTHASGDWWTVQTIADANGMGRSTANRWLRDLAEAGRVETRRDGRNGNVYRQAEASIGATLREMDAAEGRRATEAKRDKTRVESKRRATKTPAEAARAAVEGAVATTRARRAAPAKSAGTKAIESAMASTLPKGRKGKTAKAATVPADVAEAAGKALAGKSEGGNPLARSRAKVAKAAPVVDPANPDVWAATRRKGIEYHHPSNMPHRTMCGRSTLSATSWRGTMAEAEAAGMREHEACALAAKEARVATELDNLAKAGNGPQGAAGASTPRAATRTKATAPKATGDDMAAVLDRLEAIKPVSAPPAGSLAPGKSRHDRPPGGQGKTWARGELTAAILGVLETLGEGEALTVNQIAWKLDAFEGPVFATLKRRVDKGEVVLADDPEGRGRKAYARA